MKQKTVLDEEDKKDHVEQKLIIALICFVEVQVCVT